ncbi:MAG: Gfo/Idh/MocA family oxidoreductase [Nitrospirales bacterium]|nr:Gfo/Idh/MocA family oxidoreductase [Nitrospirales bacterium]
MQPIPLGLIGVGRHGSRYLQHLLSVETGGELIAISRRNMEEGIRLATEYPLRFYPNYHDLLADSAIQAVLIVTPPSLHLPIALEAIQHGKAVLLEKPLALNQTQGRQIVEAATKAKTPVMTAQTLRYEPAIRQLQDIGILRPMAISCLHHAIRNPPRVARTKHVMEQIWGPHGIWDSLAGLGPSSHSG